MNLIERESLKDITVAESPIFGFLMNLQNGKADIEETTKAIINSVEEDVRAEISKAQTVDAVPVIRCRHCKYCDYDTVYGVIIPGTEFCTLTRDECISADDFCSRGEIENE